MKKNVLVISSSLRSGSNSELLAKAAMEGAAAAGHEVRWLSLKDQAIGFCKGCRVCHTTAECVQHDDVPEVIAQLEWADIIISVSPSYWADVPGQFKAFIDRCTPWCNTHEPHAGLSGGKKGYAVALRTGPGMPECQRVISSIEHFYGHMEIETCGSLGLCGVERREDVAARADEIREFCGRISAERE